MRKLYFNLIKPSLEVYNCLVSFLFAAIRYWNFFYVKRVVILVRGLCWEYIRLFSTTIRKVAPEIQGF
jgi:predicted GNAT superfamily acetyltransferase